MPPGGFNRSPGIARDPAIERKKAHPSSRQDGVRVCLRRKHRSRERLSPPPWTVKHRGRGPSAARKAPGPAVWFLTSWCGYGLVAVLPGRAEGVATGEGRDRVEVVGVGGVDHGDRGDAEA